MFNKIIVGAPTTITPMQAQQIGISPAVYRGEAGKAPRINENGNWEVFNSKTGEWEDTGVSTAGSGGISIATKSEAGIILPGDEFSVAEDGTLSLVAVEATKIVGLDERLTSIEKAIVELDLSGFATRKEVRDTVKMIDYEITNTPKGTLVNYGDHEIRIMCPEDTQWEFQQVGATGDQNMHYIAFKAYAPNDDVVSFREDMGEMITDRTMHTFEGNAFAGIDQYGRKYSIVWLAVAVYDTESGTWSYFGERSTVEKQIGWYYSVEWYNAAGVKIAADTIRINLTNEGCHTSSTPYYVSTLQSSVEKQQESATWTNM